MQKENCEYCRVYRGKRVKWDNVHLELLRLATNKEFPSAQVKTVRNMQRIIRNVAKMRCDRFHKKENKNLL